MKRFVSDGDPIHCNKLIADHGPLLLRSRHVFKPGNDDWRKRTISQCIATFDINTNGSIFLDCDVDSREMIIVLLSVVVVNRFFVAYWDLWTSGGGVVVVVVVVVFVAAVADAATEWHGFYLGGRCEGKDTCS